MNLLKITSSCSSIMSILLVPYSLQGQAKSSQGDEKSCREFVQSFYDWYLPHARTERASPAWDLAVKERGSAFSRELTQLLREDSQAQAKVTGDIVGLDFDPFLYSQDPAQRYLAGKTTRQGGACLVEIRRSGHVAGRPDVVAELTYGDDRWTFANFHYGKSAYSEDENLLATLKTLQRDRQTHSK